MSKSIEETATYAAPPAAVWARVGDVGAVSSWVPAIESSSVEGDLRTAEFAGGGTAHERIVDHDDAARTYSYSYVDGPLALESYVSRITVGAAPGGGSEIIWTAQFSAGDPEQEESLRDAISGIYSGALAELAEQLDAPRG